MTFLTVGDAVPWFTAVSKTNPKYYFDTFGGQPVVLYFFQDPGQGETLAILDSFYRRQRDLAKTEATFVAVGVRQPVPSLSDRFPDSEYFRLLWDPMGKASEQCGYGASDNGSQFSSKLWILDPRLRVRHIVDVSQGHASQGVDQAIAAMETLPIPAIGDATRQAPVLFIPQAFEPEFCQQLITLLETHGTRIGTVLEEQPDGQAINVVVNDVKRRRDLALETVGMEWIHQLTERVVRRIKPEIEKAFQYSVSSFERPVVACYDAADQGFFSRHRDNMTVKSANRRFAMTINLNTGGYEGGCLQFPEFGQQLFNPDVGEAAIFGCSLMHQVTPVTQGQRYAFLLFFNEPEKVPNPPQAPAPKKQKRGRSGRGFQ